MHPLHVVLVHFPSALYPFAFVMDALGYYFDAITYGISAYYALSGGYAFSCLAIVFGVIDYYKINTKHKGWQTASYHAGLNILWFFGFTILLKLRYNLFMENEITSIGLLIFFGLLNLGMFVSNYMGGELVFKYKIGVEE